MAEQIKGIPVSQVSLKSENIDNYFKEQKKAVIFNLCPFVSNQVLSYDGKVALSVDISPIGRDIKEVNI